MLKGNCAICGRVEYQFVKAADILTHHDANRLLMSEYIRRDPVS
jgi:hypothetical protein